MVKPIAAVNALKPFLRGGGDLGIFHDNRCSTWYSSAASPTPLAATPLPAALLLHPSLSPLSLGLLSP